jgi:hypothetical protein
MSTEVLVFAGGLSLFLLVLMFVRLAQIHNALLDIKMVTKSVDDSIGQLALELRRLPK